MCTEFFGSPCWARTSDCCIFCEQSAVDTAKHSRLGRSYIRFRYSLFSPLTRKNSHSGCFFSVNYRLRRSVGERGIAIRDVAGWIQSKGAKRKTIRLDGFLFGSPQQFRTLKHLLLIFLLLCNYLLPMIVNAFTLPERFIYVVAAAKTS